MVWLAFGAVWRDAMPRTVKKKACALFTKWALREAPVPGRKFPHVWPRRPALLPFQQSRKTRTAYVCHAESSRSTHCFYSHNDWLCNVSTTSSSRRRYGSVTPTAHACNAKKIFGRDIIDGARLCSCNVCRVGRLADKFPKNRVVSTAVIHSFNCIVYERLHLATATERHLPVCVAAPIVSLTMWLLTAGGSR